MRTLVFVKHVPDAESPPPYTDALTIDRYAGEGTMSGVDIFAVGEAVRIAGGDSCIVATVGPAASEATLRQSLALGVAEAIHVMDDRLFGADVHATAHVLAAVVRFENPDLVVLGRESTDSRMGILPALLAELLRWPVLSAVECLRLEDNALRARRRDDRGIIELQTTLPSVVSVAEYANDPASSTLSDLHRAQTSVIGRLDLSSLGVELAGLPISAMTVTAIHELPARRQTHVATINVIDEVLQELDKNGILTKDTSAMTSSV